jgi:hypothetical protein
VDWEEALLQSWNTERPPCTAAQFRKRASRTRKMAEGATTRVVKARLLDDAESLDRLAENIERAAGSDA